MCSCVANSNLFRVDLTLKQTSFYLGAGVSFALIYIHISVWQSRNSVQRCADFGRVRGKPRVNQNRVLEIWSGEAFVSQVKPYTSFRMTTMSLLFFGLTDALWQSWIKSPCWQSIMQVLSFFLAFSSVTYHLLVYDFLFFCDLLPHSLLFINCLCPLQKNI